MRYNRFAQLLTIATVACFVTAAVFHFKHRYDLLSTTTCKKCSCPVKPGATEKFDYFTADDFQYFMYGVGANRSMADEQVLSYIRRHISKPSTKRPAKATTDYFHFDFDASQMGQAKFVDKLLQERKKGFYVDCGAGDGASFSNTLWLELWRNYSGLLVETNPVYHKGILELNRNVYLTNLCLSPSKGPSQHIFQSAGTLGGLIDHPQFLKPRQPGEKTMAECFPLNSLMLAIGINHIDYFSLDIEGPELDVLNTIDFKLLTIDVFTIEYRTFTGGTKENMEADRNASLSKLENIRSFFASTGLYREAGIIPPGKDAEGLDVVFIGKSVI